jgi:hypothetical protein
MNISESRYNKDAVFGARLDANASSIRQIIHETRIVDQLQSIIDIANADCLKNFKLYLVMEDVEDG